MRIIPFLLLTACSSVAGFRDFPNQPLPDDPPGPPAVDAGPPVPVTCATMQDAGQALPCILATGQELTGSMAAGAGAVVWSVKGELRTVERGGGVPKMLTSIAADPKVLVLSNGSPVWIDGNAVLTVQQGASATLAQQAATGLAAHGDLVFWTDGAAGTIQRCKPSMCTPETIHTGQLGVTGIGAGLDGMDRVGGSWIVKSTPNELRQGGLSPATPPMIRTLRDSMDRIVVDPDNVAFAYFSFTAGTSTIVEEAHGSEVMRFMGVVLAMAASKGDLYVLLRTGTTGRLAHVRDIASRRYVIEDIPEPAGLAVDDNYVYYGSADKIMRVAR